MKRTITIAAIALGVTLTACGSDGDSGADLTEAQQAAAQAAVDSAAEDGLTLDRSCVDGVAAQLSEEDAALAAEDGDQLLSDAGEALSIELISCADQDDLVDFFITNLSESGGTFDEDCLRDELGSLDLVDLIVSSGQDEEPPADFVAAVEQCVSG